jgi:hypothetical protein
VKLLEAEPAVAPAPEAPPPPETAPEQPPAPPEGGRACKNCGAPMEAEQDWCLSCGTAAPGRLGERPGWRAASTVVALTVLLVLGAVGAGYAAITDDNATSSRAAGTASQAQAPPATTPPATSTPPAATTTPPATPPASTSTLPKVKAPTPSTSPATPVTPAPPVPTATTPPPVTPAPSTPAPSTPPAVSSSPPPPATTTPEPAAAVAFDIPASAGKPYDPYGVTALAGDPKRALDGDLATSWFVESTKPQLPAVGYAVDLGRKRGIRELDIATTTPGFKVEIYANDEAKLPPDILDSRWSHIGNVVKVGTDEHITLGAGSTKYRNVMLWFTKPPKAGARIRLSELKLLG